MTQPSPYRADVLAALDRRPVGMYVSDLCIAVQAQRGTITRLMHNMRKSGMVAGIREGCQQASNRTRYYLAKHEAAAKAASAEAKGWQWGTGRRTKAELRAGSKPSKRSASGPAVVTGKTKVTVCPCGMDQRFTVHKPEPFFSALAPGNYLTTGSAIERAYGG